MLAHHQKQQSQPDSLVDLPGLRGIILEGEPACGKTELIAMLTRQAGYSPEKICRIAPSMATSTKRQLLREGFARGDLVWLEEFNTAGIPTDELITLIDKHPNALVVASQNSAAEVGGRENTESALQHRLHKVTIPSYSREETATILRHKYPDQPETVYEAALNSYFRQKEVTKTLCLRDLVNTMDAYLNAMLPYPYADCPAIGAEIDVTEKGDTPQTIDQVLASRYKTRDERITFFGDQATSPPNVTADASTALTA